MACAARSQLRACRTTRCPASWETVHGHVEPNETPEGAAVREVQEETGLALERLYADDAPAAGDAPFAGFSNYVNVIESSTFAPALINTTIFVFASIAFQFALGLALAVFFFRRFRLSGVLRALCRSAHYSWWYPHWWLRGAKTLLWTNLPQRRPDRAPDRVPHDGHRS